MGDFDLHADQDWNYRPLLILVIVFLGVFFVWASQSKIDQQVRATGNIIPSGQSKLVQHLEGGIIDRIDVAEGQKVEKGQPLFQIRNQRASADLQGGRITVQALDVRMARLTAEYEGNNDFVYPPPEEELVNLSDVIRNEELLFLSRKQEFSEGLEVLKEQEKQKSLKLEELNLQKANVSKERKIAYNRLQINERLRKSGAVSESKYLEAKSRVSDFDTRLGKLTKLIPIAKAELQEVLNKISEAQEKRRTKILDEMNKVEVERKQMREALKADYDEVKRRALLAPVTGIVNKIYINTVGGVVRPGEALAESIPVDEKLIVEARVLTKDRGLIWVGLPVNINVTAYDSSIYGSLKGSITEISADSFTDEVAGQFYRVKIAMEAEVVKDFEPIYPGMTVEANILSGKVSILHAILRPVLKLKKNALREP